jgi:hypothetical protein
MSAEPRDSTKSGMDTVAEVNAEDEGMVEVGKVSETKGTIYGSTVDIGGAGYRTG